MLTTMRPQQRRRRPPGVILTMTGALVAVLVAACASPAPPPTANTPTGMHGVIDTSTLRTMIDSPREHPVLVIGEATEESNDIVTSYAVTYDSAGLTISGVLRVPTSEGPHPAVVVVHGGVNPQRYVSGGDLEAEQRALLESGYVVFATDLRGYADSDPANSMDNLTVDPNFGWSTVLDWGMAWDVVNALDILRSGQVPGVDPERIGLLGHSLGGLLALDAAVIAPGSSDMIVALSAPSSALGLLLETYEGEATEPGGTPGPTQDPEYWADVSPATFFDRATEPLLMIHGSDDDVAPPGWSEETVAAWKAEGLRAEVVILDGADHLLKPRRDEAAALTVAAFDATIGRR